MNRSLMKIGDVAKLANVTVRTLHHYHQIGLLIPAFPLEDIRDMSEQETALVHAVIVFMRTIGTITCVTA